MIPLRDLSDLLDKRDTYRPGRGVPEPPNEDEVTRCIQVLMARQCVYPHQTYLSRVYAILSWPDYQEFFRRYFAPMGLEFYYDTRSRMVALRVPTLDGRKRYERMGARLKKDETMVLIALKLAYEVGFKENRMGSAGDIEVDTDELLDNLVDIGRVRLEESRLKEILKLLARKGVLEFGADDPVDRVTILRILPGIEVACPEAYLGTVEILSEKEPQAGNAPAEPTSAEDGDTAGEEEDFV